VRRYQFYSAVCFWVLGGIFYFERPRNTLLIPDRVGNTRNVLWNLSLCHLGFRGMNIPIYPMRVETIGLGSSGIRHIVAFWEELGLIVPSRYIYDVEYHAKWNLLAMIFVRDERPINSSVVNRLRVGDWSFGCDGTHVGRGVDCPRGPHHHHDEFCRYPTRNELLAAGINPKTFKATSRA